MKTSSAKRKAESLDGSYLLKSSRNELSAEDIWRNYILLTRVEAAFRSIKSPLCKRPIFHHLERRVETHGEIILRIKCSATHAVHNLLEEHLGNPSRLRLSEFLASALN